MFSAASRKKVGYYISARGNLHSIDFETESDADLKNKLICENYYRRSFTNFTPHETIKKIIEANKAKLLEQNLKILSIDIEKVTLKNLKQKKTSALIKLYELQ